MTRHEFETFIEAACAKYKSPPPNHGATLEETLEKVMDLILHMDFMIANLKQKAGLDSFS